jgi:transposase
MDTARSSHPAFSRGDRRRLLRALAQAHEARLYRRLRAVAEVAEGEPVAVVARRARVERSTVHRWVARYLAERAPSALADGGRSGRPRVAAALTDDRLRQLLTSAPRQFGYDANTWTVPLLAAHLRAQGLAISARTLRRRIRAARFRWKRPRYVYSERADHVGAKKGGLSDG